MAKVAKVWDGSAWQDIISAVVDSTYYSYAESAGTGTYADGATVSFPAGRFSQAPVVVVSPAGAVSGSYTNFVAATSVTTSGFTLSAKNASGTGVTVAIAWTAKQMTPTSATG